MGVNEPTSPKVTVVLTVVLLLASKASGQTPPTSPVDLVRYLTYQSDRPDAHGAEKGQFSAFSCGPLLGEARDDRALANRLVAMGDSALPALEQALSSLEANGVKSPFASEAEWLLLAYAEIKGPAASTRLRRMIGKRLLKDYAVSLDESVALSLGLTSYVSAFRKTNDHQCSVENSDAVILPSRPCKPASREIPIETFHCDRGGEPRDALDQFILALETGNRLLLEWSIGPQAKSTVRQLPKRTTGAIRVHSGSGAPALGYRFAVAGRWSEPDENLVQDRRPGNLAGTYINPELETSFSTRTGRLCGQTRIQFSSTPMTRFPGGPWQYFVDSPDLVKLINVIAACANGGSSPR
jgi:hypothetical protein